MHTKENLEPIEHMEQSDSEPNDQDQGQWRGGGAGGQSAPKRPFVGNFVLFSDFYDFECLLLRTL